MNWRRAPVLAAAVALIPGLLAGCQTATPDSSIGPPSTEATITTTTTAPTPLLRVAVWGERGSSNWWASFGAGGASLDRARQHGATASLFHVTGLEPVADLAELPVAVPRPLGEGWVVDQRIGVRRWSDGTPIVAHDLVFYFETVRSMGLDGVHARRFPPEVVAVEALDDRTIRVRFDVVPGPGLWPGAVGLAPFVPARFWEAAGATDQLTLYGWAGESPPRAAEPRVEWLAAGDRDAAYRMLIAGDVDFVHDDEGMSGLDADLVEELESAGGIEMVTSVRGELRVLAFNQRSAPLDDPAFRLALATVVDRAAIAEQIGGAVADSFTRPSPTGEPGRPAGPGTFDGERLDRASRVERALVMLMEAGHDVGSIRPLEILVSGSDPARVTAAEAASERMAELGLEVTVTALSPEDLAGRVLPPIRLDRATGWDMAVLGWRPTDPDPGELLAHLFGSAEDSVRAGGINVTGFRSPAFDRLVDRYRSTTDPGIARALLDEMELLLAAEVPQLPLYREVTKEAVRSGLAFIPVAGGIASNPASWPYQEP